MQEGTTSAQTPTEDSPFIPMPEWQGSSGSEMISNVAICVFFYWASVRSDGYGLRATALHISAHPFSFLSTAFYVSDTLLVPITLELGLDVA